jgi:hypothetical protein
MGVPSNIKDLIEFVSISKQFSSGYENYFEWINPASTGSKFTVDIIQIQSYIKVPDIFNQITRRDLKICAVLKNKVLYVVGGKDVLQYHVLQAIIEEVITEFDRFLKTQIKDISVAYKDSFNAFSRDLVKIIEHTNDYVTSIRTPCAACDANVEIFVKNSLINQPKAGYYPVSLVYIHKGHGLLVYIDKDFKVRGAEIVNISG